MEGVLMVSEMSNDPPVFKRFLAELEKFKNNSQIYTTKYVAKLIMANYGTCRAFTADNRLRRYRGCQGRAVYWGHPKTIAEAKKRKLLR